MGDEDKTDMKWIVCPACFRGESSQDIFDEADEEDNSPFDFKIHEIRLFLQNKTIPMVDINCPGRNDIDKSKMSDEEKEKNRFHYNTYYLGEYAEFLKRLDEKLNPHKRSSKIERKKIGYCLNGHSGLLEGQRLRIHQQMIFRHKHLISSYLLDLNSYCKFEKVHGNAQKLVKLYCKLCDEMFCKICKKTHEAHSEQIVDLKGMMNLCIAKNNDKDLGKIITDDTINKEAKTSIKDQSDYSKQDSWVSSIDFETPNDRSSSGRGTPMSSRGNSSFDRTSIIQNKNMVKQFIKELIANFEISSNGLIPNYYLMKSLLNFYAYFDGKNYKKNHSLYIKEEYRSINFYICYNIVLPYGIRQLMTYSSSFKAGNAIDNIFFISSLQGELNLGDIVEEKKNYSLYNESDSKKKMHILLKTQTHNKLLHFVSLGGGKFAGINMMNDIRRLTLFSVERRENKNQEIKFQKNAKKFDLPKGTILCPVPLNNSLNGETNQVIIAGTTLELYQVSECEVTNIRTIREANGTAEYTAMIIGEFTRDIKRTSSNKSNDAANLELFLITGNSLGEVELFEFTKFTSVLVFEVKNTKISALASIRNKKNRFVIGCENGSICYYKKNTKTIKQIHRNNCAVTCIASLNKKQIVTGGADNMLYIVELKTMEIISALVGHQAPLTGVILYPYSLGKIMYISLISSDKKGRLIVWKNGGDGAMERDQYIII